MAAVTLANRVSFTNNKNLQWFSELLRSDDQDKRFNTILSILFALYIVIAVLVPLLEQVEIKREVKERLPVQLAQIILKEKKLPLPVKPKETLVEKNKIKEETEEIKKTQVKEKPLKQPELSIKQRRELAKNKAKNSGLAAMKDELFAMREVFDVNSSTVSNLSKDKSSEVTVKRKLIASKMKTERATLSAVKTSTVVSSNELSVRNTQQIRLSAEEITAKTDVLVKESLGTSNSGQRSEMSLRRTLETHKSRLYARYNRALRKDPFLQGKVLFEIEIQPNGKISHIEIKSSALNNDKLERQLLVILRSITFPKESVTVMKTIWAVDFLPS